MPSKKRTNSNDSYDYKFKKDEKVLVLPKQHADDIYEAKVLDRKIDNKSKESLYKIHYKGWNKRWDEWVDSRRLLKINPSNLQIMQDKQQHGKQNNNNDDDNTSNTNLNRKKRKIKSSNTNTANNASNKKRKLSISSINEQKQGKENEQKKEKDENENENENGDELDIKLPTNLKRALIRDWENITKKSLLIELPRSAGNRISDILSDFESFAIKQGQDKNIVTEITRGIKDYFNQALKVTLLYKLEREQYNNVTIKHKHLTMDQIYGVEHLCRLFVKLPQLLSPSDLDSDTKQILKQQIEFIIQFVLQNKDKYFNTNYVVI